MEHLTKQQIVLLTLLVSFVTSLSTGIVTVSLMDQAPAGVTHTINQVIEKTIQEAAPTQSASVGVVSINVDDAIASATASVASSTVSVKDLITGTIVASGLIESKNGLIVTDRSTIDPSHSYAVILVDGTQVSVVTSDMSQSSDSDLVYFVPTSNYANGTPIIFAPIMTTTSYNLGQKVFALSGTSTRMLNDGLISNIGSTTVETTIPVNTLTSGTALFDVRGEIIGIIASSTVHLLAN